MKKARFWVLMAVIAGVLAPAFADAGTYYIRKREPDPVPGVTPEPAPTTTTNRYIAKPKAAPTQTALPTGQTVVPPSAAAMSPSGMACTEADMKILGEYNSVMNKMVREMHELKGERSKVNKDASAAGEHAAMTLGKLYTDPSQLIATSMAQARCAGQMQALMLQAQQQQQGKKSK